MLTLPATRNVKNSVPSARLSREWRRNSDKTTAATARWPTSNTTTIKETAMACKNCPDHITEFTDSAMELTIEIKTKNAIKRAFIRFILSLPNLYRIPQWIIPESLQFVKTIGYVI